MTDNLVDQPSPMRNYLRCLADPPVGASHLVILQDDTLPCHNFDRLVQTAVKERPDSLVSLFVAGLPNRTRRNFYEALQRGDRWAQVHFRDVHHVVALCWPVAEVRAFLDWYVTARVPGPKPPRSDDAVVGFWARTTRRQVWATVPCLVEHPDDVRSFVRQPGSVGGRGRRAICFIDDL